MGVKRIVANVNSAASDPVSGCRLSATSQNAVSVPFMEENSNYAVLRELCRYAARYHNGPNDLGGFEIETHATSQRRRNIYESVE